MVKKVTCLLDTCLHKTPVLHDHLDVIKGKVNEHTSDLWRLVWASDVLDVVEEDGADLLFVRRVLRHNSVDDLLAREQVALLDRHLGVHLRRLSVLRGHHWLLVHHCRIDLHLVGHRVLVLNLRSLVMHGRTTLVVVVHLVVIASVASLAHGTTIRSILVVTMATWHLSTSHLARTWATHKHGHLFKKHLEVVLDLFLIGELRPLGVVRVLLTEGLEIVLVFRSLVL